MFDTIIYQIADAVATIRMNRPEALNALSLQLTSDISAAIRQAIADEARAVVLTGTGRAFCSGGDLREMESMGRTEGKVEAFLDAPLKALHEAVLLIRETPIPFVASVNGVCAGAGTNLALACDIVLAADHATFNEAFVRIGLSPDCGGTFFLPRAIGEKRAAEMMMIGKTVTAAEALDMGMINRVCATGDLDGESHRFALALAAGPTASIARVKRMMNASYGNSLREQLAVEAECQLESGRSADFKEGVKAFFDKRPPTFSGK